MTSWLKNKILVTLVHLGDSVETHLGWCSFLKQAHPELNKNPNSWLWKCGNAA